MAAHRKGPADHRYCVVQVRMYGDEKFKNLSKPQPNAQSLWCFLLHGHRTTRVPGVVIAGRATLACDDLKWPLKAFDRCFQELVDAEMAVADWDAGLVYLVNAFRQPENHPASPPTAATWKRELASAPECDLLRRIIADLRSMLEEMGPAFLGCFDAGARTDLGRKARREKRAEELATPQETPIGTDNPSPFQVELRGKLQGEIPSPAPSPSPAPMGDRAPAHGPPAAVPAGDPLAAPEVWKLLAAESGDRIATGRPFPTATGLEHRQERAWLEAWSACRQGYGLNDVRTLGRALRERAIWDMPRPITVGELTRRLPDLLAEAVSLGSRQPKRSHAPDLLPGDDEARDLFDRGTVP